MVSRVSTELSVKRGVVWRGIGRGGLAGLTLATGFILAGCGISLPRVSEAEFAKRIRPIPHGAASVYSWRAVAKGLRTYWLVQDVTIAARGVIPKGWKQAGDGFWVVKARNQEGKPLPYLGVIRFVRQGERRVGVLIPKLDLVRTPDGLYIVLMPGVTLTDGKVASIRPVAVVREIRGRTWRPFGVDVPLVPDSPSPMTPAPPPKPPAPEDVGTPIPM